MSEDHVTREKEMNEDQPQESGGKCPVMHDAMPTPVEGGGNREWWPKALNLKILKKNPAVGDPMGADYDYAAEFNSLDLAEVKRDIEAVMTNSQPW